MGRIRGLKLSGYLLSSLTFAIGNGGRQAPEVAAAWLNDQPDLSYIEYECRGDGGAPLGIGIVKVERWVSRENGVFYGQHEGVSDARYASFVNHKDSLGACFQGVK